MLKTNAFQKMHTIFWADLPDRLRVKFSRSEIKLLRRITVAVDFGPEVLWVACLLLTDRCLNQLVFTGLENTRVVGGHHLESWPRNANEFYVVRWTRGLIIATNL